MYEKYAAKQREIVAKLLEEELNYTDFNSGREMKMNMGAEKTPVAYKLSPTDKDTNVLTNADRIRAMSDEELAEVFGKLVHCGGCPMRDNCKVDNLPCSNVLLEWLKQPAEERLCLKTTSYSTSR